MYSGYELLWIFFVYALLGWCTEVSYAALVTGKFVNRGFLNGPVCPIYGFGAAIIFLCLEPLKQNLLLLFLGSVLLTSCWSWRPDLCWRSSSISAGGITPTSPSIWAAISACVFPSPGG